MIVDITILTRQYAKRNERVIGIDGNFTHSVTRSLDPSLTCKLPVLDNAADQCARLSLSIAEKRGHFESPTLMFCIWSPLIEH